MKSFTTIVITLSLGLTACAKNTKVFAPEKEYIPPAAVAPWTIGGVFDEKELTVAISVNAEYVLRGRFPPHTPRLTAEGQYEGRTVSTVCMFATGVIGKGGWQVALAEAIVAKATKTGGNSCEVKVDDQVAATLHF